MRNREDLQTSALNCAAASGPSACSGLVFISPIMALTGSRAKPNPQPGYGAYKNTEDHIMV
jgi:hypothetical protein